MDTIKLINAGLDDKDGEIVAHGWLDLDSIRHLKVDDYQREVLAQKGGRRGKMAEAAKAGVRFPDIMLGMRGEAFHSRNGAMFLEDKVYIVDGLQRVTALMRAAEMEGVKAEELRIGAEVRFNTTRSSEKELFNVLNGNRTPVSPNVILRNLRDENKAVLTIYGLSTSDKSFALFNRVQWQQRQARGELTTALSLTKVGHTLHRHFSTNLPRGGHNGAAGKQTGSNVNILATTMDYRAASVGLPVFRHNMIQFFEMVDKAYGIRNVEYSDMATQLRSNFMQALARLIADHENFWNGNKLFIDAPTIRKLATFPIHDPAIARMAASGSQTLPILYNYIRDHLNKSKKMNKLRPRKQDASRDMDAEEAAE